MNDEQLYENELEYNLMLNNTATELKKHIEKFVSSHYQLLVYLGKERYVDTVVSEINKYCKKENIQ